MTVRHLNTDLTGKTHELQRLQTVYNTMVDNRVEDQDELSARQAEIVTLKADHAAMKAYSDQLASRASSLLETNHRQARELEAAAIARSGLESDLQASLEMRDMLADELANLKLQHSAPDTLDVPVQTDAIQALLPAEYHRLTARSAAYALEKNKTRSLEDQARATARYLMFVIVFFFLTHS